MIKFLQDYQTRALPPETFKLGQQVKRSDDSELYFVRLGVAGYVTPDGLVDQDHHPLTPSATVAQVVSPGDQRAGLVGGRAGELSLGLDTPQRATSGPGNSVLVGGDQQTVAVAGEITRLTAELDSTSGERDGLATALDQAVGDLQAERQAHAATRNDLASAKTALAPADGARADAEKEVGELKSRIVSLEQQIAAAAKPAGDEKPGTDEQAATDAPSKKAK